MKIYMISLCPENTSGFVSDIKLFETMDEALIANKLIDNDCSVLIHAGDIWADIATLYNIMHKFPRRLLVAAENSFANAVDVITYHDKGFNRPVRVYEIKNQDLKDNSLNKVDCDDENRMPQAYEIDDNKWHSPKFSKLIKSNPDDLFLLLDNAPKWLLNLNVAHLTLLSTKLTSAFIDKEIKIVSDISQFNAEEVLKWVRVGKKSLLDLCESLITTYHSHVRTCAKKTNLANALEADSSLLKSTELIIFQQRFGNNCQPETLEQLGKALKMTRERARQIERKALDKLKVFPLWRKHLVSHKLDALLQAAVDLRQPLLLKDIAKEDNWFSGFDDNIEYLGRMIKLYTDNSFFVFEINLETVVSRVSEEQWKTSRSDILTELKKNEGNGWTKEGVQLSIQLQLEKYGATELTEELYASISSQLHYFPLKAGKEGSILNAVGSGYTPVLLAVLRGIKEPMHYRNITLLCQEFAPSIDERCVQASLGENADLFGLGAYGLKSKHLTLSDDEVKSIIDTLTPIIRGDINRQWNCEELLKMLKKAKHDVPEGLNKYIVSIILEDIPYMKYLGRLVWILDEKGTSVAQRIDLQEAATQILKEAKKAMNIEEIKDAIAKERGVGKHFALQETENIKKAKNREWVYIDSSS